MTDTETRPDALACASCGRPVTGRGAQPKGGRRFCSFSPVCRAARDREAYQRRMASAEVPMETRPCSNCGTWMQPRTRRVTDHVLGRWCTKKSCQRAKLRTLSPEGIQRAREWYKAILEIEEKFLAAEIAPCARCGLAEGRVGFMHRDKREDSITGWCDAQGTLGRKQIPTEYVEAFGDGGPLAD